GRHPRMGSAAARAPFVLAHALARRAWAIAPADTRLDGYAEAASAHLLDYGGKPRGAMLAAIGSYVRTLRRGIRFGKRGLRTAAFNLRYTYRARKRAIDKAAKTQAR